jgi:hypothetical protein
MRTARSDLPFVMPFVRTVSSAIAVPELDPGANHAKFGTLAVALDGAQAAQ